MAYVTAAFVDTSGPIDTLTPTVTVYNLTDGTTDVAGAAATLVGNGIYKYEFTEDKTKEYAVVMDGGATITSPFMRYQYGAIDRTAANVWEIVIENSKKAKHLLAAILAFATGKASGATGVATTLKYRNHADSVDRVTHVVDEKGNRTASTIDTSDIP